MKTAHKLIVFGPVTSGGGRHSRSTIVCKSHDEATGLAVAIVGSEPSWVVDHRAETTDDAGHLESSRLVGRWWFDDSRERAALRV